MARIRRLGTSSASGSTVVVLFLSLAWSSWWSSQVVACAKVSAEHSPAVLEGDDDRRTDRADRGNAGWPLNLSVVHNRIGGLLLTLRIMRTRPGAVASARSRGPLAFKASGVSYSELV